MKNDKLFDIVLLVIGILLVVTSISLSVKCYKDNQNVNHEKKIYC